MEYCFEHDIFKVLAPDGKYYCPKCEARAGNPVPKPRR